MSTSLSRLQLVTTQRADAGIFYEWLLGLAPGHGPGAALAGIGVELADPQTADAAQGWQPCFHVPGVQSQTRPSEGPDGVQVGLSGEPRDSAVEWRANVDYSTLDVHAAEAWLMPLLGATRLRLVDDPFNFRFLIADRQLLCGIAKFYGVGGFAVRPGWIVYFEVIDIGTHVARAHAAGAKVLEPPTRSPINTYAVLEDPWGHVFGFSEDIPKPEGSVPVELPDGTISELVACVDLPWQKPA